MVSGHTHDAWVMPVATRSISKYGNIVHGERLHVKIPSAKDLWGTNSWEDLKGMPPKPLGAYWLKASYHRRSQSVQLDVERAR